MAGGRPSTYNEEIALEILRRMSEGETVTRICESDGMPKKSTVWLWSITHPEFSSQYARAITCLGQCYAEGIDTIDDDLRNGLIDPATARVLSDNKKWRASKFYPKMYSEKQIVESKNETVNYNVDLPLTDADQAILNQLGFKADE